MHFTLTKAAYAVRQDVQMKSHEFITDEELKVCDIETELCGHLFSLVESRLLQVIRRINFVKRPFYRKFLPSELAENQWYLALQLLFEVLNFCDI